jgi:branched-chain amino acid transport system ATP-binding protein
MSSSLQVRNLVVRYGGAVALRGVTLEARRGQVVCILGRNGAGKSTLFRTIMGLVAPASGEIDFEGRALHTQPAWTRVSDGVAFVPEAAGVIAKMSVYDNLRLGAYHRRLDTRGLQREIERCAEIFPIIKGRLRSPAGHLSGGERQMVALARALMAQPKIILLDEPSFGLAPLVLKRVFSALKEIAQTGCGVVIGEQVASEAFALSEYGYVLDRGTVAFEGPASDLAGRDDVRSVLFAKDTKRYA